MAGISNVATADKVTISQVVMEKNPPVNDTFIAGKKMKLSSTVVQHATFPSLHL
jgi:hypothetical protein